MKKNLLTKSALERLENEYENLLKRRKEISNEIKVAREFGDLSENAEYHAARESQSHNETEIIKVRAVLDNYELVDEDAVHGDVVALNSIVTIKYDGDDETEEVVIVPKIEAEPFDGKISNESPIGIALLGTKKGQVVKADTPDGEIKIEIIDVK